MLKKTIKYEDFNGEEVIEDYYFHLSKAELVELEMSHEGGLSDWLKKVIDAEDGRSIIVEFKKIILGAYGKRSSDGRRFTKNQQLRDEFESTEAYSTLFMELVTDADKASEFVNGVIPQSVAQEAAEMAAQTPILAQAPAPKEMEVRVVTRKEMEEMSSEDLEKVNVQISVGEARLVP